MKLIQVYENGIRETFTLSESESAVYNHISELMQFCKRAKCRQYIVKELNEFKYDITAEIAEKLDEMYPDKKHPDLDLEDIIVEAP